MDTPFDQQSLHLVAKAQQGDPSALDELLQRHLPGLRVFVRAKSSEKIRAKESCSDLVQTVCREALGSLERYEWQGEGSFRHWLYTLAMNKLRNRGDYYAASRRNVDREIGSPQLSGADALSQIYGSMFGPSQHAIANEAVAEFEASLDKLSDEQREIILLSRVVGLSNSEIATKLEIEVGTARTRLSRALSRLASVMAERAGPDDPPTRHR